MFIGTDTKVVSVVKKSHEIVNKDLPREIDTQRRYPRNETNLCLFLDL